MPEQWGIPGSAVLFLRRVLPCRSTRLVYLHSFKGLKVVSILLLHLKVSSNFATLRVIYYFKK